MDKEEQFDWLADEDLPFMDNKTTDMLDLDPHSYEDEINEADYIRTMSQACRDPNMDAEILESFADDVYPDIRLAVAGNPSAYESTLKTLLEDPVERVRQAAFSTLAEIDASRTAEISRSFSPEEIAELPFPEVMTEKTCDIEIEM